MYKKTVALSSGTSFHCIRAVKKYGKCSKILINFLFLFLRKMSVIRAGFHIKMLFRITNRDDTGQTTYVEAV